MIKPSDIAPIDVKRVLRYACSVNEFYLGENCGPERPPTITMRANTVTVGCTTVTRDAIERLNELFQKHYPKGQCNHETKIQ